VLQMPEDDSFLLVRSSQASRLQLDGDRPIAALAFDSHKQLAVRFKPYCLGAGPDDAAKVDLVGQILGIVGQLADRLG
jgi:hypothetical protein